MSNRFAAFDNRLWHLYLHYAV